MICENPNAIWLVIDGSQKGTDIIYNIFQEFEINDKKIISIKKQEDQGNMLLGKLDEPCVSEKPLDENFSKTQMFKIYYERFASPRKLMAVPRIKPDKL